MKSKYTVIWAAYLLLIQACAPIGESLPDSPLPGPIVSTAVAVSTGELPPLPSVTDTSNPGGSPLLESGITLQDGGKTFKMKVGDSFLLNLGAGTYDWTVSVDNEDMLRIKRGVLVIRGAQGIYEAVSPGTATLTATGNPLCGQSTPPCMMPSILFSVTLIVE